MISNSAPGAGGVLMVTGRADFGGGPEHVYQLSKVVARSSGVFIASPKEEPYWSRYETVVGAERMIEIPHRQFSLGALGRLARFIRSRGIKTVHAHGRAAGILGRPAALLAGVPCFYTPHGGTPVTGPRTALYAAVEYVLSLATRGIIAVSGTEAKTLRRLCAIPGRVRVVPNGVEIPQSFGPAETRLGRPLRVVHATRFVFQKNSGMLLDVIGALLKMERLDQFEFFILGDGPGRAEFEAEAARRGLSPWIKLAGAVTDPGAEFSRAFCFISTSRWEGLPLALLEAMARGVPAIATDVPGNQDAVRDHDNGFLYGLNAPEVAARRLVEMAQHPALWKQMVRASRRRAEEEFSVESMAAATLSFYAGEARNVHLPESVETGAEPSRNAVITAPAVSGS